jgi:DNA-directed RNA polymerase subunit omega
MGSLQRNKMTYKSDENAGLTSQAAVAAIGNRYDLVLVAARRLRELNRGDAKRVLSRHNNSVVVLEEIEQGKVTRDYLFKEPDQEPRRRSRGK